MNRRSFLSRCLAAAATVVARAYAPAALVAPQITEPATVIDTVDFYETDFGMVAFSGERYQYATMQTVQAMLDKFERSFWYGPQGPPKLNRWQRRQRRLARRSP
jgi:hypothetical protein